MTRIARRIVIGAALAWAAAAFNSPARAQYGPQLDKSVAAATTIVIARLDQYIAEPESVDRFVEQRLQSSTVITGNDEAMVLRTVQPRGTYVFTILGTIKGQPPKPLVVRLPRVMDHGLFGLLGPHTTRVPLKGTYLLLLKGDQTTGFSPVATAPVQISAKVQPPKEPLDTATSEALLAEVVRIYIESLADPLSRSAAADMLSNTQSDAALAAMKPLADDPDDAVRSNALECMAVNQDVAAIPKIAAWKYSDPNRGGNPVDGALEKYKTPAAIPYLNALLKDSKSQWTRLNAAMALRQIPADKTSIPSLIKALRDPENHDITIQAYYTLLKLIPDLGPPQATMTKPLTEDETQRIETWWADEQAGKHK